MRRAGALCAPRLPCLHFGRNERLANQSSIRDQGSIPRRAPPETPWRTGLGFFDPAGAAIKAPLRRVGRRFGSIGRAGALAPHQPWCFSRLAAVCRAAVKHALSNAFALEAKKLLDEPVWI